MNTKTEWNCYYVNTRTGETKHAGGGGAKSEQALADSLRRVWATWDIDPYPHYEGWTREFREEPAGTAEKQNHASYMAYRAEQGLSKPVLYAWKQQLPRYRDSYSGPMLAVVLATDEAAIPPVVELGDYVMVDDLDTLRKLVNGWYPTRAALVLGTSPDGEMNTWFGQQGTPDAVVLPNGDVIELARRAYYGDKTDITPPEAEAFFREETRGRTLEVSK